MLKLSTYNGVDQIHGVAAQCRFLGPPKPNPIFPRRKDGAFLAHCAASPSKTPVLAVVSDRGPGSVAGRVETNTGPVTLADRLRQGSMAEDGKSYKECFIVRCYEVGINKTATVETIANLLQEVGCNHAQAVGFSTDGFATTTTMRKMHLIWVTARMHIDIYKYPAWSDVVEIETWCQGEGRIGTRRDWILKDYATGAVIGRATRESWCFCKGVSKSEKMKAAIFSGKAPAMARISGAANGISGTGFLIHRSLLLTTHVNLPSVAAAESSEIRLQNGVAATLVPQRFFITSSILDLTIVGLDAVDGDSTAQGHLHHLRTCSKPNLDLGSVVYLLGYTEKKELTVGEGKVVIATDNLIKLSTDGVTWSPGSAGFDAQGNLAFMICDPMKLATSPNTKSSSTSSSSSSSWKKDHPMQFGIPIPIICDWLNQHWEGSLDDLNKPKLPLIRLMSSGQKSEHSCASFTQRRVFKSTEGDNDGTPSSSNTISKPGDRQGPSCSAAANTVDEEALTSDCHAAHVQGIPTPEIYESPKLTAIPLRRKEGSPVQLLDINFPPRVAKPAVQPQSTKKLPPNCGENFVKEPPEQIRLREGYRVEDRGPASPDANAEIASTGSFNGAQSEVESSSFPVDVSYMQNGYSSEGETMYSAETAESRNYTIPADGKFQEVGRSQSCGNYNRWGATQSNSVQRRALLEKQRSFIHGRKMHSQAATSQRSNDYYSPTVSSIMKKRNSEQPVRPRQSAVHSSPKWNF